MSVEAMTWAFSQPLPPAPKLVLLALANAANREGLCWPGIEALCAAVRPMQRRQVQRHVQQLAEWGLLSISARFSERSGVQLSNCYQLILSTIFGGEDGVSDTLEDGISDRGRVSQLRRPEDVIATTSPDKNLEPSAEPSGEGRAATSAPPPQPQQIVPHGTSTKAGQPRGHRASRFPDGWQVEDWMVRLCQGFGLNPHQEFAEFRNHHLARGTLFASWPHAFRTWVAKSVEFKQRRRA